jgi:hypothetical protein
MADVKFTTVTNFANFEEKDKHVTIAGRIKEQILNLPRGKSLALVDLKNWVLAEKLVKDQRQAYIRIGNAVDSLKRTHVKIVDKEDNYTYIIWRADLEDQEPAVTKEVGGHEIEILKIDKKE